MPPRSNPTRDLVAERIGQNMRRLREDQGLTQSELAKLLPKTGSNDISKYERGAQQPRPATLYFIMRALRATVDDMLRPPRVPEDDSQASKRQVVDAAQQAGQRRAQRRRKPA